MPQTTKGSKEAEVTSGPTLEGRSSGTNATRERTGMHKLIDDNAAVPETWVESAKIIRWPMNETISIKGDKIPSKLCKQTGLKVWGYVRMTRI